MKGKTSCRYYQACGGPENCSRCAERYSRKESKYRVQIKRRLRQNGIDFPSLNTLETPVLEELVKKMKGN